MRHRSESGFTLIELMVVVAVIAILAVIAVPKFGEAIRKSRDASTKANLGAIRSALSIYASDNPGTYPSDHLESLIVGSKYLAEIPEALAYPHHDRTARVDNTAEWGAGITSADTGSWLYFDNSAMEGPGTPNHGDVWVGCTHSASDNRPWSNH